MIIRIQNYDNKAPVAEISLLNLSNWTLWSVTPPHLSLSLSPHRSFYPPTISLLFLLFQPDVLLFRPSVIFGSSSLSSSHHLAPFICPSCCRFDWRSPLRSFFFPVLWLWGHFQWVCFIPISSFSFPSFHVFVRIDDSCLLALPLSCFLPFILFFFLFCPTFSFLLCCHHLFRSCLSLTHITVPRVFLCFSSHTSPLCDAQSIIPVPYCTISWQLVDAYIF